MTSPLTVGLHRAGASGGGGDGNRDRPQLSWVAVPVSYLVASVPFSYVAAAAHGVDLRQVGTGTVSGTGLYEVAGFVPLAGAGILEVAKGAVGPLLAGPDNPGATAAACAAAVIGHNWSPFLRGAGGRGLSPAIGALLAVAPAASAALLAGMVSGRLAGETALGSLAGDLASVPVARRVHGSDAARCAAAVVAPMLAKRLAGNRRPQRRGAAVYLWRLLFDRDQRRAPVKVGVGR